MIRLQLMGMCETEKKSLLTRDLGKFKIDISDLQE